MRNENNICFNFNIYLKLMAKKNNKNDDKCFNILTIKGFIYKIINMNTDGPQRIYYNADDYK